MRQRYFQIIASDYNQHSEKQHLGPFIGPFGEGREPFSPQSYPVHRKALMCIVFWMLCSVLLAQPKLSLITDRLGLPWGKPTSEFWSDSSCRFAGSSQEDELVALLNSVDLKHPSDKQVEETLLRLLYPTAAQSLGDKSQKEKTWQAPKPCPCSSPTHHNSVRPFFPRLAALGSSSPGVAVCSCYYLLDFPSQRGALRGGTTKGRYFLFFVSDHVPTPQSLVLSTLSIFGVLHLFGIN